MHHSRVLAAAIALVFLAVAFGGMTASAGPVPRSASFLVDESYAQFVETTLVGLGTWPGHGFRAAGSAAEHAATEFIAAQMAEIGLQDVRREPVPVDAWDFAGAKVTIGSGSDAKTFDASSMGGVPGTGPEGVSGEIVYVGRGAPGEYPADGVEGKLLLVDWDADWFWVNLIGHQATISGAKGVIISTMNHPSYYAAPDSLGSFDGTYDDDWVPLVVISRNAGFEIMDRLAQGPVMGTLASSAKLTLAEDGGTGYNVVGVLPGTDHEHPILVLGHHDAWFYGASDDTSAIAGMLAWAKAAVNAGYEPTHDLVFVATTGEEYGNTDAYYEWLVGAWYFITQAHPDLGSRAIAFLNLEGLGGQWFDGSRGPFTARSNFQLAPLVREVFAANPALLPDGGYVFTDLSSWQDGWTLTAAGIPGVTFGKDIPGYDAVYHTNLDDLRLIDYHEMALEVEVMQAVLAAIDRAPVLPYAFSERAFDLGLSVDPKDYSEIGVDASALDREISMFRSLARKFDRVRGMLSTEDAAAANALLMEASQLINREWTALSCWDAVIYPTQQVEWDAGWLTEALVFLRRGQLDGALDELWNVGLTWNAFFDYTVWKWENDRHAPGVEHLNWGAQGHLAPYVDIYAPYVSLREKAEMAGHPDVSWETAALKAVLESEKAELRERVSLETQQVAEVNALLMELLAMAA